MREKPSLRKLVSGVNVIGRLFMKVFVGCVKTGSLFMIGTVVIYFQFPKTVNWLETGTE